MEELEKPEKILKRDRRGRVVTEPARREAVLDEFERSGMSGAGFAKLHGIKYSTFASWVARRKKERQSAAVATRFAEVVIDAPDTAVASGDRRPLRIGLPGGARLEVSNGEQARLAAELLSALARC